jgi:hypothetical protein
MTRNPGIYRVIVVLTLALLVPAGYGQVCQEWKPAERVGELEVQLDEASGLAASRAFPGRLYHINDSGDSGKFHITNLQGSVAMSVSVRGGNPIDTEALALGKCRDGKPCLYIGDIGDNDRHRQTIQIIVIEEVEHFPAAVAPRQRLTLRYPDGPHDAESLAVAPQGDLFILTKEQPARLYKAEAKAANETLAFLMTVDTGGFAPTDMAISDDGTRLLLLTYLYAMEIGIDFAHPAAPRYRQRIVIQPLQQEESIAYLPGSRAFVYTTERVQLPAWLMRVDCKRGP